jgi:type II secretory pathway pseudopilin PulG
MRGGKQKQGYTVVEVLIFLAVSGMMFVIAASFISGKQAKGEFRQGINDMNTQIRQAINDVANGYYPSTGNFVCQSNASGVPSVGGPGIAKDLGAKQGCTFLGKVLQFNINGSPDKYNTYTVVGRQFRPSADPSIAAAYIPPSSFSEAMPVVAGSLTQSNTLKWGIQLDKMTDNGTDIGAFGIFSGFSETDSDNNLDSGAAPPAAIGIPDTTLNQDPTVTQSRVADLVSASINTTPRIVMCFSGAARQYGRLTIGTSGNVQGQKLTTSIQITSGAPTAGCP